MNVNPPGIGYPLPLPPSTPAVLPTNASQRPTATANAGVQGETREDASAQARTTQRHTSIFAEAVNGTSPNRPRVLPQAAEPRESHTFRNSVGEILFQSTFVEHVDGNLFEVQLPSTSLDKLDAVRTRIEETDSSAHANIVQQQALRQSFDDAITQQIRLLPADKPPTDEGLMQHLQELRNRLSAAVAASPEIASEYRSDLSADQFQALQHRAADMANLSDFEKSMLAENDKAIELSGEIKRLELELTGHSQALYQAEREMQNVVGEVTADFGVYMLQGPMPPNQDRGPIGTGIFLDDGLTTEGHLRVLITELGADENERPQAHG